MDDDEDDDWGPGCLGVGSAHAVSERSARKITKNPIGFVHFPDKPENKPRAKAIKKPAKRRKR